MGIFITSRSYLKEAETIQIKGTIIITAISVSTTVIMILTGSSLVFRPRALWGTLVFVSIEISPSLVFFVMLPLVQRHRQQHQEQDHCNGGGVAHVIVSKGALIDVVHQGVGRRTGAALGHNVHLAEHLEGADDAGDGQEEGRGLQLGQGDVLELLPLGQLL